MVESPEVRRDRLTALMVALQPVACICATDDPAAALLLGHDSVELRLRSGGAGPCATALVALSLDCAIPLHEALHGAPDRIVMATGDHPALAQLAGVLLDEAAAGRCGSAETVARLSEAMLVLILRRVLDGTRPASGVLAGLSHQRLHRAMVAIHGDPAAGWTVETLAEAAGMSRSRFMAAFRDVIGLSPLAYATRWRMDLARAALARGAVPRDVARQVGYGSVPALRRAMRRHGHSPVPTT